VVGPALPDGPGGPWIQLAHLVVADVPPAALPGSRGDADNLAEWLRSLDAPDRPAAFDRLVRAASGPGRSGDLGYFVHEQLSPPIADLAFTAGVRTGDVLGPVVTALGTELFLVEAWYDGPLDERSTAALIELRRDGVDPLALAAATAYGDAARANGGPWRPAAEVASGSPAHAALFETRPLTWSDPFVLHDQLLSARVLERRTAVPDARSLARLAVVGFEAWLQGKRAATPIEYAEGEDPMPRATATPGGIPTPLPQGTPRLPVVPGTP
jgi:hypothetical protein